MPQELDLEHFVQHRQLEVYEQTMARLGYAYGVDIRRARWLASSSIGNALVRAVDRAWPGLASSLMDEQLEAADGDVSSDLLREVAGTMRLLRAPVPSVRVLREDTRRGWPAVTPLGSTHGSVHWLVLDLPSLEAMSPEIRGFALGSGLGHLQCDHGIFYSAHQMAARRGASTAVRLVRRALRPWSRVMSFSADRAGLLVCGSLELARIAIQAEVERADGLSWLPRGPKIEQRLTALEEFERSSVFARVQGLRERERDANLLASAGQRAGARVGIPDDAWSLARVDQRLTERLKLL
jgi:hypothetical protein